MLARTRDPADAAKLYGARIEQLQQDLADARERIAELTAMDDAPTRLRKSFGINSIFVRPYVCRLLVMLTRCHPNRLTAANLFARLYGDRDDGGPTSGRDIIGVTVHHARAALKKAGAPGVLVSGMGYTSVGYGLTPELHAWLKERL